MTNETPSVYVVKVDVSIAPKMKADLIEQGFECSKPPYTVFSAKKKGVSCTLYESGKLTVQGKDMRQFIEFYLEPEVLKSFSFTYKELDIDKTPRIGVDETGKGDYFGPLCIAAVFAGNDDVVKLHEIGVTDSKKLTDPKAIAIGKKIQSQFQYHIVKINPAKYNEMYAKFKNLNRLLAWGHATVIKKLAELTQCNEVILDQFGDESLVINALGPHFQSLKLTQRHKGEEDIVVAAASILARKTFLEGMAQLSQEMQMELPKGASKQVVQAAKKLYERDGREGLAKAAKLHFKTTIEVIEGKQS
jgi:ribonuclease HIII